MLFGNKSTDIKVEPTKIFYTVTCVSKKEDAGVDSLSSAADRMAEWALRLKEGQIDTLYSNLSVKDQKLEIIYFPKSSESKFYFPKM